MKEHKGLSSILKYFEIADGKLLIGGNTAEDIAAEVGTPFYVYDLQIARKKYEKLRSALPSEIEIHYAVKANPHPQIVEFFQNLGTGFDVASAGELNIVLKSGVDLVRIGFAGPGKREEEIQLACEAGIGSLNVEGETELEIANLIAAELRKLLRVSIRINPAYELVGSGMKMGGGSSQFGIDQEDVPRILQRFCEWPHLDFVGFHIFSGSQNLFANLISPALQKGLDTVISLLPYCPKRPEQITLGGGFGIPYYADDDELNIQAVAASFQKYLDDKHQALQGIHVIIEIGRYLVGEAGVYVSRVLYRKASRGKTFLILDGGMHHHLAASGNLGQIIKKNFPIALPQHLEKSPEETVILAGPLCAPIDRLATNLPLPKAEVGDLVAIFASGAYGFSTSPRGFLSHPQPAEVVLL